MVDGIQEFIESIKTPATDNTTTYSGVVSKIDREGTIWVYLEGSDKETPVASASAEVKKGDNVNVEWRNNRLYIGGNVSNPSAGVVRVQKVETIANNAKDSADIAFGAASRAIADAERAYVAAESAETSARDAQVSASSAQVSASRANVYANSALDQLGIVENIVGVLDLLQKNGNYQPTQDEEVEGGKWYFTRSGTSPDFVYSVVTNPASVYHLTEDTAIESGKTYYTRSGTGTEEDPYVYTEVSNPVVADIGSYYEKYYELVGIDEAIQNYVSNQLVVDDNGLWLKRPDSTGIQPKVLLSATDGVVLYGTDGTIVGKYGKTAQIGDSAKFHIDIGVWYKLTGDTSVDPNKTYYTRSGTVSNYVYTEVENPVVADIGSYYEQMPQELGFYQGQTKVAYISNNQLYITQSVVLEQMDLGKRVLDGGLGQWSWKLHPNSQTPSRNNLNLKWIG